MPVTEAFLVVTVDSDGCTYHAEHALAAFTDRAVADLVAEELNKIPRETRSRRTIPHETSFTGPVFAVRPISLVSAASESRVRGIVNAILDEHFPRPSRG